MKSQTHQNQTSINLSKTRIINQFAIAIIAILFASSCVPAGGGNPSPTNAFNVGLGKVWRMEESATYDDTIEKSITIDGDEINFKLSGFKNFVSSLGDRHSNFHAYITFSNNNYEVLTDDTTRVYMISREFNGKSLWNLNTIVNNTQFPGIGIFKSVNNNEPFQFGEHSSQINFYNPFRTDYSGFYEYLIFRKPKNSSYQYYWVKVLGQENWSILPTISLSSFTIKIENGRYQMDGIVAGQ